MARPKKYRKICHFPKTLTFLPVGNKSNKETVTLTVDEYETLRLIDKEGRSQEECSSSMKVARTTVQMIYASARKKVAEAIVDGRSLEIEGQWLERELSKAPDYIKQAQQSASAKGWRLVSCSIAFGEEYSTMYTCVVTDTPGTDEDIDTWLQKVKENKEKQKKAEKKVAEEKMVEQRMEEYTFKGADLKSVTDSFIAKMSSLSTTMSSMSGFDMKI